MAQIKKSFEKYKKKKSLKLEIAGNFCPLNIETNQLNVDKWEGGGCWEFESTLSTDPVKTGLFLK